MSTYSPGDWVIYRKSKRSTTPGPRAQGVHASLKGEKYSYVVDKFWVVQSLLADNQLVLRTRRGKLHTVPSNDANLRHANFLDRLFHRHRFREAEGSESLSGAAGAM